MKPAVFLDRDGVLCTEKGYITNTEQMEIFPYAGQCVELLHNKGYLAICITNQSAVARGYLTEEKLQMIHAHLISETGLDALYYCPHHPDGKEPYYIVCECRKPGIGLITKAAREWKIDLSHSYMVGDRASDILCGKNAGLKTILLESGYGTQHLEQPVVPDAVYEDLWEFVQALVLCQEVNLKESVCPHSK